MSLQGKYNCRPSIPEVKEWIKESSISDGSTEWFAENLEELISLNRTVHQEIKTYQQDYPNDVYEMAERQLRDIIFDYSYLQPFLHEVTRNHNTNFLGLVVSAMINKIIDTRETIVLDLDKYNVASFLDEYRDTAGESNNKDKWKANHLGYKHERGKLVIKGRGYIIGGELCCRVSGGEVEIHSSFKGGLVLGREITGGKVSLFGRKNDESTVNIGPDMKGGNIYVSSESIIPAYGCCDLIVGERMQLGEIIIDGNVYSAKIGEKMARPKTSERDVPSIIIKGYVVGYSDCIAHIGDDMDAADILIEGYVKNASVGSRMKSGRIFIKGDVGTKAHEWQTTVANQMEFGTIWIDGNAINIGRGMNGGRVIIGKSAYNIASQLKDGIIDVGGPVATISGEGSYNPNKHNGTVGLGHGNNSKQILPSTMYFLKSMVSGNKTITFESK